MTRDQAIERVRRGLGFRGASFQTQAIIDTMTDAQLELERAASLPWFTLSEDQTLSLATTSNSVSLPTGFLHEAETKRGGVRYTDDTGAAVYLTKVDFDYGQSLYLGEDDGPPEAYTVRASTLYVWPRSDQAYTLYWSYHVAQTSLATNVENNWLLYVPSVLIGMTGRVFAQDLRDDAAIARFAEQEERGRRAMLADEIAREHGNRDYAVGARL